MEIYHVLELEIGLLMGRFLDRVPYCPWLLLAPRVYRELQTLARTYLRRRQRNQTLQHTALVNEAWLRLIGQQELALWESRAQVLGIAARLMRLVLVDYARTHRATKRESGQGPGCARGQRSARPVGKGR